MNNRENIVEEYFQLRILLNKTNLRKDEKTDIEFLLRHNSEQELWLMASLKKISASKTIEICRRKKNHLWRRSEYSGLFYLEDYCAQTLNRCPSTNPETSEIKTLVIVLNEELRNLGIPR